MGSQLLVPTVFLVFLAFFTADAYDSLDPNGNIILRWDILEWHEDWNGYQASITISNYQLYRHIENPGWKLSWDWPKEEIIWGVRGGEATLRGNCSRFAGKLPHCCNKRPVIVDLLPGAPLKQQTANCCKGGVLSSRIHNETRSSSTFLMSVGYISTVNGSDFSKEFGNDTSSLAVPTKFDIGVHGYTCSQPKDVMQTRFPVGTGRRHEEAIRTLEITCAYSQKTTEHHCCVSLSSFYNSTIVPCATCTCGCRNNQPQYCTENGNLPVGLKISSDDEHNPEYVLCTEHMCPIRIHWHIMKTYKEYWRVKISITNFNLIKNYSDWNLVLQHPNLDHFIEAYSFMYTPLNIYTRLYNVSGVFSGIPYYNDMLLQYGENGVVQSDILLQKIHGQFTLNNGWGFPKRIDFNGEKCALPDLGAYPTLPGNGNKAAPWWLLSSFPLLIMLLFLD